MKKILSVLLSVYCLTAADLHAADAASLLEHGASVSASSVAVQSDVLRAIPSIDYASLIKTLQTVGSAALKKAALDYAAALLGGQRVPDDAMHIIRTASTDIVDHKGISERQYAIESILWMLTNFDNIISLPNAIPPFLRGFVVDHTAGVHFLIDVMRLNSHIAEHMKHRIGHYYEDPYCGGFYNHWTENSVDVIQNRLNSMTQEYKLLDDAVKNGADLTGVKMLS